MYIYNACLFVAQATSNLGNALRCAQKKLFHKIVSLSADKRPSNRWSLVSCIFLHRIKYGSSLPSIFFPLHYSPSPCGITYCEFFAVTPLNTRVWTVAERFNFFRCHNMFFLHYFLIICGFIDLREVIYHNASNPRTYFSWNLLWGFSQIEKANN